MIAECEHCRGEIYAGDDVYRVAESGAFVHEDCAKDYAYAHVYDASGAIDEVNL